MKIAEVLLTPGLGGFFYDDQLAIRAGAQKNGEWYDGDPITKGFRNVRVPSSTLGIGLILEDNYIAWGDMMGVQYSGAAGRDPFFDPKLYQSKLKNSLVPLLIGKNVNNFREISREIFQPSSDGNELHCAIQYGLSQALLDAVAHIKKRSMAQVICEEYGIPLTIKPISLLGQCGDHQYGNVDKLILKKIDILPHGLINSSQKFGTKGEHFLDYVRWVVERIKELGDKHYSPSLHFDIYGMAGIAFENSIVKTVNFLIDVEKAAKPFDIIIESPADFGSTDKQIEGFSAIFKELDKKGSSIRIVADEWCNTLGDIKSFANSNSAHVIQIKMPDLGAIHNSIEAVLFCKKQGVSAYLGGSCTETDISSRVSVHVGVATQPEMLLCKPGMGVDEAISITRNEQNRLLAELSRLVL